MNTAERRLKLLKMEGEGFSKSETVQSLSVEFACAARTVYNDFETRESWQPYTPKAAALVILNRFQQIYRKASLRRLQSKNENAILVWLRIMLDVNKTLAETFIIPSLLRQLEDVEARADKGVFL